MSKRFVITILSLVFILVLAILAALSAKGYKVSPKTGTIAGTGIISVVSEPDQASVYLDDHLIGATDINIPSLEPKKYSVRIEKDGFIPWNKDVYVREELVSEIKARLFPALPSLSPLTFNGAEIPLLSPDGRSVVFIVPGNTKKSGVWVWTFVSNQIGFARGGEPHQIMTNFQGLDLSNPTLRWSPDSKQVLLNLETSNLLLEENRLNDTPRDITPILQPTLRGWDEDQKQTDLTKLALIKDITIHQIASSSAYLKFSPDETKLIYSKNGIDNYKSADLKTNTTFDLPPAYQYIWLPDSLHFIVVDNTEALPSPSSQKKPVAPNPQSFPVSHFLNGKISIMEFEGTNKAEIFAGKFDLKSLFPWPDSSRIVFLYSVATNTASAPNLYGLNLK